MKTLIETIRLLVIFALLSWFIFGLAVMGMPNGFTSSGAG